MNNSTTLVDPSVYGYGVQKRPLDDGGKLAVINQSCEFTSEIHLWWQLSFLRAEIDAIC